MYVKSHGRTAAIVLGLGTLLGAVTLLATRFWRDETDPQLAVVTAVGGLSWLVFSVWAVVLAFRSLPSRENGEWAFSVIALASLEILVIALLATAP